MGRAFEFRKGRKLKRWASMAKIFTKVNRDVTIAVKEAGPDPETNAKLRIAIQNAKALNVPKDNVDRAIQKAMGKDAADYKEIVYEGNGPHKVAFIVETATDNLNRTVANVRSYFAKYGGTLASSGSHDFIFSHDSVFKIKAEGIDIEELELDLIDHGLEELFPEEDCIVIYAGFKSFGAIQKALEDRGVELVSAEFERNPNVTKELSDEQKVDVEKLIDKLEEDEDVVNIFHNMVL
jgi:transcriptional/translational regulatory protein YebC/TACO1